MSLLRCNFTSNQFLKGKKISSEYVSDLIKFKKRNYYFNRHIIRQKLQFIDFHRRKKQPTLKKSASVGNVNYMQQQKKKEEFVLTSYLDNLTKSYISHSNNHYKEEGIERKNKVIQEKKIMKYSVNVNEQSSKIKLPTINNNSIKNQSKVIDNYKTLKQTIVNVLKQTVSDTPPVVQQVKQKNTHQRLKNKSTSPDNSITNFFQQTHNTPTVFPGTTINKLSTFTSTTSTCKLSAYSYFSLPGTKMQLSKENQDSILILPNLRTNNNTQCHIFGVFDGHGDSGKNISELVSTYINNYYTNTEHITFTKETIRTCIHTVSSMIKQHSQLDLQFSGTTLNMVYVDTHYLYCANIGDSRSIAITSDYSIIQLSTEHKPEHPMECKRILQMGGEVGRVNWSNEGPCRVWLKGKEYPGLSISRSIGDLSVEDIGVISEPDVTVFDVYQLIKIVVIGTDGLWEFLSNEQVKEIVCMYYDQCNNTFDSKAAGNTLINESRRLWEIKNPLGIDDISIIILFFN